MPAKCFKIKRIRFFVNPPLDSNKCEHGEEHKPKNWPRWRLFSWQIVDLWHPSKAEPKTLFAKRLWVYTRTKARDFDLYLLKKDQDL